MSHLIKTDRGLKVAMEPVKEVRTLSIGIWIKVGSRQERQKENGMAHLMEHMLFKGTQKRKAKTIMEEIEGKGGYLNAFTSREYTCIYGKVLAEDRQILLDILEDVVYHSSFDKEALALEKKVVLEEIAMTKDAPEEWVQDQWMSAMLTDHPLGRNILGEKKTISAFTRQDLVDFHKAFYQPANMVVSVSGRLEEKDISERILSLFDREGGPSRIEKEAAPKLIKKMVYEARETQQTHICLGRKSYKHQDPEYYPLILFNNILGGSASSRLFQEIREKQGLAYSVYSYQQTFADLGILTLYAASAPDQAVQVLTSIYDLLSQLEKEGVSPEEFERAKAQTRAHILMGNESVDSKMKRMGSELILEGRIIEEEEHLARLEEVTLEDLQSLARTLCNKKEFSLYLLGPKKQKADLEKVVLKKVHLE